MTKNYQFVSINTLTDANVLTVNGKNGRKLLALTQKGKTAAGTVVTFTQYAFAEPANELEKADRESLLRKAPYMTAGRNMTIKSVDGVKETVVGNAKYMNVTGWVKDLGTGYDAKKAEARKAIFNA